MEKRIIVSRLYGVKYVFLKIPLDILFIDIPFFCIVRLMSSESSMFEGFMVEARESSDFFGEGSTMHQEDFDNGSTIWGTWVTDPNQVGSGYSQDDFLYHAIECNRSLYSNEGPFEVGFY